MTRHFSADHHFGHHNIIRYSGRPYASVDEMNEALVENWNRVVRWHDEVWILGDLCMGRLAETLSYVGRLNGNKILVAGNHDKCWFALKGWKTWADRYLRAGIDQIVDKNELVMTLHGHKVLASHFPYRGDHGAEDRFSKYRPVDRGMTLLHGHVHEKWKQNGRMINVGVDVWDYRPVAEEELVELIR